MSTRMPEPVNWNDVKIMLEAQDKKITTIAEGFADLHPRIVRIEKTVDSFAGELKDFKGWLQAFNTRLETLETK